MNAVVKKVARAFSPLRKLDPDEIVLTASERLQTIEEDVESEDWNKVTALSLKALAELSLAQYLAEERRQQ